MPPGSGRPVELWYLSYLLLGLVVYGLGVVLMPLVVAAAGHRPFRIGAVIALQNVGLLSAPLWGLGMDRIGRHRLVLLAGSILITFGFVGLTIYTSLSALLISACVIGIGTAAATTATMVFVIGLKPAGEWSERIGYLQLFNSIGTTLGLALAGLLTVHTGTIVGASAAMLSTLLARLTLPASAAPVARAGAKPEIRPAAEAPADAMRGMLPLAYLFVGWFVLVLGISCFSSPYPIIMHHVFDVSVRVSSSVISVATLAGLPLYAICGFLIRRFGSPIVMTGGIACRFLCLAGIGYLSLYDRSGHRALLLLLTAVFQACWPIVSVSVNDRLFRVSSLGRGLATGLLTFIGALATAAGALLGGAIAEQAGYGPVAAAAAVCAGLALLMAIWRSWREAVTRSAT